MKKVKLLSLFALSIIVLSACKSLSAVVQEPRVSFNSVDITKISFSGVDMIVYVDVENPNGFSIPLPKIDWELFINTASFIKGSLPNDSTLRAREKVTIALPLSVTYEGLYRSFRSLLDNKEAAYRITLDISFPIPFIADKVYHLEFSGVIPMLHMPAVSFQGISRKSLFPTMEFALNFEVENKNAFDFNIGEFNYEFRVNNRQWTQSRIDNPPRIRANSKTPLSVSVSISAVAIVTEITSIISQGTAVTYSCTGNMSLLGSLPGLDKLELPLNLQGNTRILTP